MQVLLAGCTLKREDPTERENADLGRGSERDFGSNSELSLLTSQLSPPSSRARHAARCIYFQTTRRQYP